MAYPWIIENCVCRLRAVDVMMRPWVNHSIRPHPTRPPTPPHTDASLRSQRSGNAQMIEIRVSPKQSWPSRWAPFSRSPLFTGKLKSHWTSLNHFWIMFNLIWSIYIDLICAFVCFEGAKKLFKMIWKCNKCIYLSLLYLNVRFINRLTSKCFNLLCLKVSVSLPSSFCY